jgi:3-oxoacyl-ACP reductase-like protein
MPQVTPTNVSVGLIAGLLTQGAAIVWTVSMMMSDIEENRNDIYQNQINIERLTAVVQAQAISNARIDENIKAIRTIMERRVE